MIIISYAQLTDVEARTLGPKVVHVDGANRIVTLGADPAEPMPGTDQRRGPRTAAATR